MIHELDRKNIGISEDRQGNVRSWAEMDQILDVFSLEPGCKKFARGYFRAQKLIAEGRRVKARRLFDSLEKITGYRDFEDNNPLILKTIDIAVKGKSNISNNSNF